MKNVIRITDDEFMDGEPFVIEVGNGDALISTPGSLELIANTVTIPGDIRLSDEGFVYTSAIDNHRAHASPHIYIRPRDANSEVRATVTGTTTEYVKVRAREFVAGGINGDGIFSADNSIAVLRAGPDSYAFVQSDLEVRATKRFSGSSYVPVRASSFPSGSLEEFKTNIKKWEESALDIIRNADIYEYNLKNDLEVGKNKKRYGLVIGDGYRTPEEVIDGDGIEQYAMNSISWKAIQELDTEQQELKGRIAWLEAENKLLREKIKKLEGMIS